MLDLGLTDGVESLGIGGVDGNPFGVHNGCGLVTCLPGLVLPSLALWLSLFLAPRIGWSVIRPGLL